MKPYLPILGGAALILIGGIFLMLDMMDQTVWRFIPAFAAILAGTVIIIWRLPR
jgi:hypothetical protein